MLPATALDPTTRPDLPLLDALVHDLGPLAPRVRIIVGLQHLLGSTVSLFDALSSGLARGSDVFLLGKPYSTSPRVHRAITEGRDWWVHPESMQQAVDVDNDSEMDRRIDELLQRVVARINELDFEASDRVLLIDDGGRAIRVLHSPRYRALAKYFVCVEQTRCGVSTLEGLELSVPVVNVAQSQAKLVHESPMIAESVIHELQASLRSLYSMGMQKVSQVSILGYGSIGAAVAHAFADRGIRVQVYDADATRLRRAAREGMVITTCKRALLRSGGLVVGCTGRRSVGPEDYDDIAHNAVVVSASSADLEFQAWNLRPDATCLGRPGHSGDDPNHPCFSLYRVHRGARGFYLINGGFPVNFTGDPDPIDPQKIQLTRALLYLGAHQASRATTTGWIDLDSAGQTRVVNRTLSRIAA